MTFREVFLDVYKDQEPAEALSCLARTTEADHPRVWKALEHAVLHRYERKTRCHLSKPVTDLEWEGVREWLKANWGPLVQCFCSIIMLLLML